MQTALLWPRGLHVYLLSFGPSAVLGDFSLPYTIVIGQSVLFTSPSPLHKRASGISQWTGSHIVRKLERAAGDSLSARQPG